MKSKVQPSADQMNRWHQNDVKSAAFCGSNEPVTKKTGDGVVLFLVSKKTKSKMTKLLLEQGDILNEY